MAEFTRDPKAPATYKQMLGVAAIFSGEDFKRVEEFKERDMQRAFRIVPCIKEHHTQSGKPLLHEDVQKLREAKTFPKKYRDLFDPSKIKQVEKPAQKEAEEGELDITDPKVIAALKKLMANADKKPKASKASKAEEVEAEVGTGF